MTRPILQLYFWCLFVHLYQGCWTLAEFTPVSIFILIVDKFYCFVKGNPNFQGILDWILQILHYYCRKQHKNIENSRIIEQNLVLSLPFSLFTAACASCRLLQRQNFFISWTQYSANFKRNKWSFVPYIVSFFGTKMVFSKLS